MTTSQSEFQKDEPIKRIVSSTKVPIRDQVKEPREISAWTYRKWSADIARIFRYERIKTLGDIITITKQQWQDHGFSPRMMNELETALWRFGLELKKE